MPRHKSAPLAGAAALMATLLATPALFAAEEAVQLSNRIVDNPYSLEALWAQGDLVARGTLAILAVMSVATWYILICKLAEQHRLLRQARAANATFWQANSVAEGIAGLPTSSPFRSIATTGLKAAEDHEDSLIEKIDLHSWISMSIQRSVAQIVGQLQGGLAVLATVGSTAPFVGLFGTVWGIYHALTAIGIAGQASIDKVAGPVGEALIMTALGLAVAVPAVLGYNWLVRRNKTAIDGLRGFASDLHSVLLSGRGNKAQARTIQHKPAALG